MIGPGSDKKYCGTQVATIIGPVEAKFGSFGEIRRLLVGASCEGFEHLHEHKDTWDTWRQARDNQETNLWT